MPAMAQEDDIPGNIGDLVRFGTIEAVQLADATATVRAGDVVSPPLHWLEMCAGAFRSWSPPTVGEQVTLICPEADIAAAVILRGLYCASFPAPGTDANPRLIGPDGLIIALSGGGLSIEAPDGIAIIGDVAITGTLNASEDVVGGGISLKTHKHGGVQAGGAQTGTPV
jgi:phage baseplate assembly protein gpV